MEYEQRERFLTLYEGDQHDPDVQYEIGVCYLRGEGVEQDGQEAERWLRMAAGQGHTEAQALLDSAREQAAGPRELNEETLPDWCMKAEAGDAEAQYRVAEYFQRTQAADTGEDVERYLKQAVEQGHPLACLELAKRRMAEGRNEGTVELLKNAADCGVTEAAKLLGECLSAGRGVKKDMAAAEERFAQAAQLGGAEEMLELAVRYATGDGVDISRGKSMSWVKRALDGGLTDARERFNVQYAEYMKKQEQLRKEEERAARERAAEEKARKEEQARQAEERRRKEEQAAKEREAVERARRAEQARLNEQRYQEEAAKNAKQARSKKSKGFLGMIVKRVQPFAKQHPLVTLLIALFLISNLLGSVARVVVSAVNNAGNAVTNVLSPAEKLDAFENLKVNFVGIGPNGTVDILNNSGNEFLLTVHYTANPDRGLSNGDTVVVTAEYDEALAKEYGCRLKGNSKTYTVEGLDTYVTELSQIDEACCNAMIWQAADSIESFWTTAGAGRIADALVGYVFGPEISRGEMTQEKGYLLTRKPGFDQGPVNRYTVVYRMPVTIIDGFKKEACYDKDAYFAVTFCDITMDKDGVAHVSFVNAEDVKAGPDADTIYTGQVSAYKEQYIVTEVEP